MERHVAMNTHYSLGKRDIRHSFRVFFATYYSTPHSFRIEKARGSGPLNRLDRLGGVGRKEAYDN